MESDTNIEKPERSIRKEHKRANAGRHIGPRRSILFSRLTRVIFLSHLFGLAILMVGALTLNQYSQGLIKARTENLTSQALLVTSIMGDTATGSGVNASLDVDRARQIIRGLNLPDEWRLRLHDTGQNLVLDSEELTSGISVSELPPLETDETVIRETPDEGFSLRRFLKDMPWRKRARDNNRRDLPSELRAALDGTTISLEKYDKFDRHIVTVSTPVKRVTEVLGVITLDSYDVEDIIDQERLSLIPILGWAIFASLISSIALTMSIVFPLRDLSRAAEIVARTNKKIDQIPDFSYRKDEIGDLSVILGEMTGGLYTRIDDIANFAADVAHEIKNPLTSLRSASDTLRHAKTDEQKEKLIDIIQSDVGRMDRLISDISKASKVDANLAREKSVLVNVPDLLGNVAEFYEATQTEIQRPVIFELPENLRDKDIYIRGFETPFAQVLRNLIDNALTFSPEDGVVRLSLYLDSKDKAKRVFITVEDDGPGIPAENLETIFERFYTERPKGAQFGSHSGLGLAICRQIVNAHKGSIRAENRIIGNRIEGAKFTINLPLQG